MQTHLVATRELFDRLNEQGIEYCHWKSNRNLDRALSGLTDLDLLVERSQSQHFKEILHQCGCKRIVSPPDKQYPAIEDYLGYDADSGRLFHLHVHYQLILGEQFVKNYRLPFGRPFPAKKKLASGGVLIALVYVTKTEIFRADYSITYRYNDAKPFISKKYQKRESVWIADEKNLEIMDYIIRNNVPVVYEKKIQESLNENSVMDRDMYNQICKMFESEDGSNHILAMECMANCDYKKSCVYLLSLFEKFTSEIVARKERNHVNFKALSSFFNNQVYNVYGLDKMVQILKSVDLLTHENYNTLIEISKETLTERLNSQYIKVKDLEPTELLLSEIEDTEKKLMQKKSLAETENNGGVEIEHR